MAVATDPLMKRALAPFVSVLLALLPACQEDYDLPSSEPGLTTIEVDLDLLGGSLVTEEAPYEGRIGGGTHKPMSCSGPKSYCRLSYCHAAFYVKSSTQEDASCHAPTAADGRYHVRYTAVPRPGYRVHHWDLGVSAGSAGNPTISLANDTAATVDVSWAMGPASAMYRHHLAPVFVAVETPAAPDAGPPSAKGPDLAACDGAAVTDVLDLGGAHEGELLVLCSSVVLTKKDGRGSRRATDASATAFAEDGAFVYFDAVEQGAHRVRRAPLDGGASEVVGPASPKPIRWIGVDEERVYFLGSGDAGEGLYSAFKDGRPYAAPMSHAMFAETKVLTATVSATNVDFAVDDGDGAAKVLAMPKGSDLQTIPTVVASAVKPSPARLRESAGKLHWGAALLEGGAARTLREGPVKDAAFAPAPSTSLYVTTDTCVELVGASSSALDCSAAPDGPLVVDAAAVYWLAAGAIVRTAR